MSDLTPISIHSREGIDVGSDARNMNYLYGLSDFFGFVFEDTETLNLMMEAGAAYASEIYSKFLQQTSSLSLATIQSAMGVAIKLVILKESDRKSGSTYYLDIPMQKAAVASNRPFLPTEYLESGVDFEIEQVDDTRCTIKFARPLSSYKFSRRPSSTGEDEFAIWFTDCVIDEQLVQNTFGLLVGVNDPVSSERLSNLVYGLHFLYMNGPTFKRLEQGLNICLGVPVARETEEILDIRYYLDTDGFLIITNTNQYIIPPGADLEFQIGDTISAGEPLSKWIELKDHVSHPNWWRSVIIPPSLIPTTNSAAINRFASEGTYFDWIMSNYLKQNTFLVSFKIDKIRDSEYYERVFDTIRYVKPSYCHVVYSWKITLPAQSISMAEGTMTSDQTSVTMNTVNTNPINDLTIG